MRAERLKYVDGGAGGTSGSGPGGTPPPKTGNSGTPPKESGTPDIESRGTPDIITPSAPRGKLVGKLEDLTHAEREFVERTLASGKDVEIIPTGADRTPDFLIDGVRKELKTVSGVANETSDGISAAIASRVMDGRGQAVDIVVDATKQPGITQEIAERGVRRAFGADNATGGKIQSIQVVGPDFDITVPRMQGSTMEKPAASELQDRIERQMSLREFGTLDSACWRGYLAALIEWNLLTPNEHRRLIDMLPELDADPTLPILLGPEAE